MVSIIGGGLFFVFTRSRTVNLGSDDLASILEVPEAEIPGKIMVEDGFRDIEDQPKLPNPPRIVKAVYATGWSAGSSKKLDYLIDFINKTELNAIVIDVKDFSGHVSYGVENERIKETGALEELRILRPNAMIKKLHDSGIYVIARVSIFQDPILAEVHPEWALKVGTSTELWKDNKGLAWMDAASREVWDYNILVARDALRRGFDEVNFDYIRFPSDGNLDVIGYPYWDGTTPLHLVIKGFFKHLRESLPGERISADLFGLSTVSQGDLGIGQLLEDAFLYFDYVSPMVYPSHYAPWSFGYQKPALEPYGVVGNSLKGALQRLVAFGDKEVVISGTGTSTITSTILETERLARLRPWIQDFDLGAEYTPERVRDQILALNDVFCGRGLQFPSTATDTELIVRGEECDFGASGYGEHFNGWMLWDPTNVYTLGALVYDKSNRESFDTAQDGELVEP